MIRHWLGLHHMLVRRQRIALTVALSSCGALAAMAATPNEAKALTIVPLFNSNLSASSINTINTAIAFYQNTFSDPITVTIGFNDMSSGLGESTSFTSTVSYAAYSAALFADRKSADDATASVQVRATEPVSGQSLITVKTANGRAVGLNTQGGIIGSSGCYGLAAANTTAVDACIGVNLALTNDAGFGVAGGYGALAVFEHEMDEVLGLGSGLSSGSSPTTIQPEDLFRYANEGVRSNFVNHACNGSASGPLAYFSIDQGATNLDPFDNCDNGGDYGDWATTATPQVQDAFGTEGTNEFLTANTPEVRALDVVGYDLKVAVSTVPEPGTFGMFGVAIAALAAYRKRRKIVVA